MGLEELLNQNGTDPATQSATQSAIEALISDGEAGGNPGAEKGPEKYELTQEEEKLLCSIYVDEERILNGFLFSHQVDALNVLRFGHGYLEEKYPGTEFVFLLFHPSDRLNRAGRIIFSVSGDENKTYRLDVTQKGDTEGTGSDADMQYEARDDYYKIFVRDEYDEMLQNLIAGSMGIRSLVYTDFTELRGREIDGRTPVEVLVAEKEKLSRRTSIFLERNDVEYNTVSDLRTLFKDNGLYGSYGVYFANGILYGQNDPEQLLLEMEEVDRSVVGREYFNCFDIER